MTLTQSFKALPSHPVGVSSLLMSLNDGVAAVFHVIITARQTWHRALSLIGDSWLRTITS
jgi:hypothetical protein